ncbi:LysR family transcriptional regulator [Alkalihalobacillus sp. LMS39]|uniref:LysR family transcriptional regulator n=1 Tax=Alkalihalobacillus sp. LMS39 TaxID=2924032 RepID=UPI001FB4A4C8|nr:LysR family transcriptional regulator [Alkalihalobacillus sp. LMS39]UOE95844.1 LysR family transcriptional regulator [Alkalihalobacillus sp. LMS39]
MKIDEYRLLIAIKNVGTIRGAAKALHLSQPAISQRVKQIEEHWGEKLFIRTKKKLLITPAGEKIIEFGEELIERETKLLDEISKSTNEVMGRLSLGVSSVVGQYLLPEILESYIEQYPQVNIELFTGLSQDIRHSINQYHIAIIRGEKIQDRQSHHLFSDKLYIIERKDVKKEKLLIEFKSDPSFHSVVDEWLTDHPNWRPTKKITVDQIETCKQLMLHGIGMAILPESAITDLDTSLYNIHPLISQETHISRPTWISYSENATDLPQVKAFLDILTRKN